MNIVGSTQFLPTPKYLIAPAALMLILAPMVVYNIQRIFSIRWVGRCQSQEEGTSIQSLLQAHEIRVHDLLYQKHAVSSDARGPCPERTSTI